MLIFLQRRSLLDIKEMHIKTIMRYYFTATKMTEIRTTNNGEQVEKLEHSHTAVGNVKRHDCFIKSLAGPQKVEHRATV